MSGFNKHELASQRRLLNGGDGSASPSRLAGQEGACANLEVNVIFTGTAGTLAALLSAAELARDLNGSIRLVAAQEVPFGFPLECPPVSVELTRRRLADLVAAAVPEPLEAAVYLCLCRSKLDALVRILQPNSLVVIGGKSWWPNEASWTARKLRSQGHHVIFVPRKAAHGGGKAPGSGGIRLVFPRPLQWPMTSIRCGVNRPREAAGKDRGKNMLDIVYLLIGTALFAITWAFTKACDRL